MNSLVHSQDTTEAEAEAEAVEGGVASSVSASVPLAAPAPMAAESRLERRTNLANSLCEASILFYLFPAVGGAGAGVQPPAAAAAAGRGRGAGLLRHGEEQQEEPQPHPEVQQEGQAAGQQRAEPGGVRHFLGRREGRPPSRNNESIKIKERLSHPAQQQARNELTRKGGEKSIANSIPHKVAGFT